MSLTWTKASDIYSFGVTVFEVLTEARLLPFSEYSDTLLAECMGQLHLNLADELLPGNTWDEFWFVAPPVVFEDMPLTICALGSKEKNCSAVHAARVRE